MLITQSFNFQGPEGDRGQQGNDGEEGTAGFKVRNILRINSRVCYEIPFIRV